MTKKEIAMELCQMAGIDPRREERIVRAIVARKKEDVTRVWRKYIYGEFGAFFALSLLAGVFPSKPMNYKA